MSRIHDLADRLNELDQLGMDASNSGSLDGKYVGHEGADFEDGHPRISWVWLPETCGAGYAVFSILDKHIDEVLKELDEDELPRDNELIDIEVILSSLHVDYQWLA